MPPLSSTDPELLPAWRALSSQLGEEAARAFFSSHVVNGPTFLAAMEAAAAPVGHTALPTSLVDGQRYLKVLERTWLVTNQVLRVSVPGQPTRRIPLNFSTLLVGPEGSHSDIEVPMAVAETRLRFTWMGAGFALSTPLPGPLQVNERPYDGEVALSNGDRITLDDVQMRVFRLLEPPAELIVVSGPGAGERYLVDISEVRLGRFGRRDNDIYLQDPTVSREHASIIFHEGHFWLRPESTVSPTIVNGEVLTEPRALIDNDQLLLGEQTMLFRVRGAARPKTLRSRMATILFSDLRGWTPLAETMPLQDLIWQMDEYFKEMGEIITVHGGTLLTYQGDAVMAVFGAPSSHSDDPWRAVSSAWLMQARLQALNAQWLASGRPPLSSGIGLHTGLCVVGEMGHQSRLEYAAMGDTSNLAARLEQITRDLGSNIIMSDATYHEVADRVDVIDLGEVALKGRSVPTHAYSLTGLRGAPTS